VVFMALGDGTGDNGFVKWIPEAQAPFFIRRTATDAGLMIGYGGMRLPLLRGEILIVDSGAFRASPSGVWHGVNGVWTQHTGGGLPDQAWDGVVSDPTNLARWIVWGTSAGAAVAYLTIDSGATWNVITGLGAGPYDNATVINDIAFSKATPGAWCAVGHDTFHAIGEHYSVLWFGTLDTSDSTAVWKVVGSAAAGDELQTVVAGAASDWISTGQNRNAFPQAYYTYDSSATTYAGMTVSLWDGPQSTLVPLTIDRAFGSNLVAAVSYSPSDATIVYQPDYTSTTVDAYTAAASSAGATIAAVGSDFYHSTTNGDEVGAPTGVQGLYKIVDLTGTPVETAVPQLTDQNVIYVRSDRTSQRVLGMFGWGSNRPGGGGAYVAVFDGVTWSYWPLPGSVDRNGHFAARLEVLGRGGA
jgi:hypothetical protein